MKQTAVIYARFSSHTQTEQSIEGQLRECYEYAKKNDYVVVKEYIDRALTATTDRRPQFLKMVEDSKRKSFQYVIVYQFDRFARNRYDSATYKNKLKKNGVRVLSAKENITNDPSGILVEGMLESMAEYYSAELSQKVKRGLRQSAIKGTFTGGYLIYGYKIVDKKWTIDELQAKTVKQIFNMYKEGKRSKDIVDKLKAAGIKKNYSKNRDFTVNIIARMLRNKKYVGVIKVDNEEFDNVIPPIIDKETFDYVNSKLDKNKHKNAQNKAEIPYVLSGKLYCANCGGLMTAETGTGKLGKVYHYYKCFNKKKNKNACDKNNVRKNYIEELIINKTLYILKEKDFVNNISKLIVDRYNTEIKKDTALVSLRQELKHIDKQIENIMNALANGIFNNSTQNKILELESAKSDLEDQIAVQESQAIRSLKLEEVKAFINTFKKLDYKNQENRVKLFEMFVNRVDLYDDTMSVSYNATLNPVQEIKLNKNTEDELVFKFGALGGEDGI